MNDIRVIMLGGKRGGFALVSVEDFDRANRYRWHAKPHRNTFYVASTRRVTKEKWETLRLHRVILPGVPLIDHKNGFGFDCARRNLREATALENNRNSKSRRHSSSEFKGVSWTATARLNKWRAVIQVDGQQYHLGYFTEEVEAARAYNVAAKKFFGQFAHLNPV